MKNLLDRLDGYKSYIGGAIIFVAGGLLALEVISEDVFKSLSAIGVAISVYGIRHAIRKVE